jgi:hemolysin type calcium-binding protein
MSVTVSYSRNSLHPEFRSNSFTFDHQLSPDLVGMPDGQFVSAYNTILGPNALEWYSASASGPSGMPRFPAEGATRAGAPSLTQLHNGNTLVVWDEHDPGDPGLKARLYGSNGVALGGELALINGTTPQTPRAAGLRDGGFALAYGNDGGAAAVALFDDNGNGSVLGIIPASPRTVLAVAALSDGGFVVTHTRGVGFFGSQQLYGRVYNADGSVRRAEFLIESAGAPSEPDRFLNGGNVVGLPNGNWAVAWDETGDLGGGTGIRLKIFNPTGDAVSGFIQVNAPSLANERQSDITVLPNGFIVVGWARPEDVGGDIHGRIFDQDGNPIDLGEFALSSMGSIDRAPALAAVGPSGQFVTSWQDDTDDGSGGRITSVVSELVRHSAGDDADDTFTGDVLNDIMQGGGGNDSFRAGGGTNTIEGGAGSDTAVYDLALSAYQVRQHGAQLTVTGPSLRDTLSGIEQLQFADGTLAADDGNGVFDSFFYMTQNPDVFHAGVDAVAHYDAFGWREGRDPNEFFDTSGYLAVNPDVAAAVNPLEHYMTFGWREGRDASDRFHTADYLAANPDVAAAGVNPLEHFLQFGFYENRAGVDYGLVG